LRYLLAELLGYLLPLYVWHLRCLTLRDRLRRDDRWSPELPDLLGL
jgi:hypothetical protein